MDPLQLLVQWGTHGVVTFAVGLLPFLTTSRERALCLPIVHNLTSFIFVESLLASLTAFGTGRLVGSGLFTFFGRCATRAPLQFSGLHSSRGIR